MIRPVSILSIEIHRLRSEQLPVNIDRKLTTAPARQCKLIGRRIRAELHIDHHFLLKLDGEVVLLGHVVRQGDGDEFRDLFRFGRLGSRWRLRGLRALGQSQDDGGGHIYRIVYANDTKVKYLILSGGNRYGITPLYNSDGTLQVYSDEIK